MESHPANPETSSTAEQQSTYPEPSVTSQSPYPALHANAAFSPPHTSSYGPFPGSSSTPPALGTPSRPSIYGAWPGGHSSGTFPGSQSSHHGASVDLGRRNPGRGGIGVLGTGQQNEPSHLAPVLAPKPFSEVQKLAPKIRTEHGESGTLDGPTMRPDLRPRERGGNMSELTGQWEPGSTGGGRASARAAWRAAVTYGGMYEYDEDAARLRDPDMGKILEDLDRAAIKQHRGRNTKPAKGRGGWRKLLKDTSHADVGKVAKEHNVQRGRPRGRRGSRKTNVDPGREFKEFMQLANKAYVENDLAGAADNARLAVQANPEIFHAHALLSEILMKLGRGEEAVHALWQAAVAARTVDVWVMTAERILEVAGDDLSKPMVKRAIDCYAEALKMNGVKQDPDLEFQIRVTKFQLYRDMNDHKGARIDCKNILARFPGRTHYCREYAILCAEWQDKSELNKAREAYEQAFTIYEDRAKFGDEDDQTDPFSHLNIYLELVDLCGNLQDGIAKCKRLARWFLGRKEETFWDRYVDDDREFDEDHERRNYVGEFQQGRASRDLSKYGQGLPIDIKVRMGHLRIKMGLQHHQEARMHFQPLLQYAEEIEEYYDMFLQVAAALRDAGFMKEAAEYYDIVRKVPNADDPDDGIGEKAWMQFATCYQVLGREEDAITCYEVVTSRKGELYTRACSRLAKLYEDAGEIDKARFLCNELILLNRRDLLHEARVRMVPTIVRPTPAKSTLALLKPKTSSKDLVFESSNATLPSDALTSFRELLPNGPLPYFEQPGDGLSSTDRPKKRKRSKKKAGADEEDSLLNDEGGSTPKRPRLKKVIVPTKAAFAREQRYQTMQDAHTRSHANFTIVQTYWSTLKGGLDEEGMEQWVEAANGMLDDFTSMKVFFPDKDKTTKLKESSEPGRPIVRNSRNEDVTGPKEFLSIPFSEWHRVFVDLTVFYAKSGEQDRCYRVLQGVLFAANVFVQDVNLHWASYGAAIYCGLAFNDSQYLIELARKMAHDSDFRAPHTFHLFAALNRFSFGSNWFSAGPSQKFMLRMVKMLDYLAMDPETRDKVDWSAQKANMASRAKKLENQPNRPRKPDTQVLLLYGHMVAVANHSHSALPYYYRALALQPDNICVNLSIATMWIQNSMKRQTENRQHGLAHGLAFLFRYYDLRVADGRACHLQEAEYNVARMWHYLGLTHLALPVYEKVLQLSERVQAEGKKEEEEASGAHDVEDFAPEAAFAMQRIFSLAGNDAAARQVTEEWLVI